MCSKNPVMELPNQSVAANNLTLEFEIATLSQRWGGDNRVDVTAALKQRCVPWICPRDLYLHRDSSADCWAPSIG